MSVALGANGSVCAQQYIGHIREWQWGHMQVSEALQGLWGVGEKWQIESEMKLSEILLRSKSDYELGLPFVFCF